MKNKKFNLHYAWIILLAVSLIRGIAGPVINASAGVFLTPVSKELGIGIGQLSLYLSVSSVVTLFWLPVAGNIFNKYKVKKVVLFGILLQTLAFTVLGFMNSVWAWYILSAPLAMGGTLLVNLLGPLMVNRWFTKNVGLVMGLMMMITSLMGAVFQPVLTTLVEQAGWRNAYIYMGIFGLLFMLFVGLLLLKDTPQEKKLLPYGMEERSTDQGQRQQEEKTGISVQVARKSPAFFALLFFMIVITGFASFSQHIATFGLGTGLEMASIGTALSVSMIGSAIGSVLIGFFSDRCGIVPTSIAVLITGGFAIILYALGGNYFMVFVSATFLHGLATSSIGVVAPLLTKKFFGNKDYEKLFSTVMIGSPLASIVLMPAYGYIYDMFGNYQIVFIFLLIVLALAGIGLLLGNRNSKKILKNSSYSAT